jgi:hypothetical protein
MKKPSLRKPTLSVSRNSLQSTFKKRPNFKVGLSLVVVLAVIMTGGVLTYWYKQVLTNPDRILSGMLEKSLRTTSVERTITQEQGDTNLHQITRVSYSPQLISRADATLSENTSLGKTVVKTQSIGTSNTDYIKYTGIDIQNPNNQRNFDNVIGEWGKRETNLEQGQQASFLDTAMFMAVPFGNLNDDQKRVVLDQIKKVDLYNYTEAKIDYDDGRPTMRYKILLNPQSLVRVLAEYAKVTGVGDASQLDPAQYEGAAPLAIQIDVDVLSRHVKVIDFGGSGRIETYSAYNVQNSISIPEKTVDVNELQTRLSNIESDSQ